MSGICGVVNLDGAPAQGGTVEEMTDFLAFRGPDGRRVGIVGAAGLGHAMLRTTHESACEQQPCTIGGDVWITADARIDGRETLRTGLARQGRHPPEPATDPELILHAYLAWGEDCVRHLLGDFCFAIWDAPRRRLFCARDHFGVKPFFYSRVGQTLVFSNSLDCVRRHPAVSSRLDELAIGDFLLFGFHEDPAMTAFAAVRRLPASGCMTASGDGVRTGTFWSPPSPRRIEYRAQGDYVEHFLELLGVATADRLRTDRVGVLMSGGLDSPAIAATALREYRRLSMTGSVRAYTSVYDALFRDDERRYAALVAEKLHIAIRYEEAGRRRLYEGYDELARHFQEPRNDPLAAVDFATSKAVASEQRVALTGYDGDALLADSPRGHFAQLLRERRYASLAFGLLGYAVSERKLVPRSWLRGLRPGGRDDLTRMPAFPPWLDAGFVERCGLRERWAAHHDSRRAVPLDPMRPHAHKVLRFLRGTSNFFDEYDPGHTRLALEYRHPFLDLRLVDYCLSLPPHPWCVRKEILRRSMAGLLPDAVRFRPKTPLAGFPHLELLRTAEGRALDAIRISEEAETYLDRCKIPALSGSTDPDGSWRDLRPLSLDFWLRNTAADRHRHEERCT